jgi:hypothetical protein
MPPLQGAFEDSMAWLQNATLELTTEASSEKPRYIYNRAPKKLHGRMKIDPRGIRPPIGWSIWVEEDFFVPWYL